MLSDYVTVIDHTSGLLQRNFASTDEQLFISIDIKPELIPEKGILVFSSKAGSAWIEECNDGCLPSTEYFNVIEKCHCETRLVGGPCAKKSSVETKRCTKTRRDCCSEDSNHFEIVAYDEVYKMENCQNLYVFTGLTRGLPETGCSFSSVFENKKDHIVGEQVLICPVTHFNFCDLDLPSTDCEVIRGCLSAHGLLDDSHLMDRGWITLNPEAVWGSLTVNSSILHFDATTGTFTLSDQDIANHISCDDGVKMRDDGVIVGNYTAGNFIELEHITQGDRKGEVIIHSVDNSLYGIDAVQEKYNSKANLSDDTGALTRFVALPSGISRAEFRITKPWFLENPDLLNPDKGGKPYKVFYDTTLTLDLDFRYAEQAGNKIRVAFDLLVDGTIYGGTGVVTPSNQVEEVDINYPMDQIIDYVHVQLITHTFRQSFRYTRLVGITDVQPHVFQLCYKILIPDPNLILSTENSITNILYI